MSEASDLEVSVGGNRLFVNGLDLDIDNTTPEYLYRILNLGRTAILKGIEDYYEVIKQRNPDAKVNKTPLFVVRLGTNSKRKSILSKEGQNNLTSVHTHPNELNGKYHGLWHAINHTGFAAEARSGLLGPNVGGIWLMLKSVDKDDAIKAYFTELYPEYMTCEVLPDTEEGIAPIRISDRTGQEYDYMAPTAAIKRLNRPRIDKNSIFSGQFDSLLGMGLIACKVLDNDISEDIISAEFPTTNGPKQLLLPKAKIAKKHLGR